MARKDSPAFQRAAEERELLKRKASTRAAWQVARLRLTPDPEFTTRANQEAFTRASREAWSAAAQLREFLYGNQKEWLTHA